MTEAGEQAKPEDLARRFVVPPRFAHVDFDGYQPDTRHHSQAAAKDRLKSFTRHSRSQRRRWPLLRPSQSARGLYLDGGFGVGKTHLLAASWNGFDGTKAYVSFLELTAFIGLVGMNAASATFSAYEMICIDEFELDDVANTLMVVSFLRNVLHPDLRLLVTSNTVPDRLGEQRFSAADFKREIAAIASHFEEITIEGSDFRSSPKTGNYALGRPATSKQMHFTEVMALLVGTHPARYRTLLDGVDALRITDTKPISDEADALRFVTLVDALYDKSIPVDIVLGNEAIFTDSYRHGAYRKRYGRAESRMEAMRLESADLF